MKGVGEIDWGFSDRKLMKLRSIVLLAPFISAKHPKNSNSSLTKIQGYTEILE